MPDFGTIIRMAAIALGLWLAGSAAPAAGDEPFGLSTVAVSDGGLAATWRQLQEEMREDRRIVAQCRATPASCASPAAVQFIALVDEGGGDAGLTKIGHINRAVNLAIGASSTRQSNWSSPLQSLAVGHGDCKQYTVLKYAVLMEAGFAADDLRIVIVRIRQPSTRPADHAVVAVRNDAGWIVLDNRSLAMLDSAQALDRFQPLFVLDAHGVRRFVPPPGFEAATTPCG